MLLYISHLLLIYTLLIWNLELRLVLLRVIRLRPVLIVLYLRCILVDIVLTTWIDQWTVCILYQYLYDTLSLILDQISYHSVLRTVRNYRGICTDDLCNRLSLLLDWISYHSVLHTIYGIRSEQYSTLSLLLDWISYHSVLHTIYSMYYRSAPSSPRIYYSYSTDQTGLILGIQGIKSLSYYLVDSTLIPYYTSSQCRYRHSLFYSNGWEQYAVRIIVQLSLVLYVVQLLRTDYCTVYTDRCICSRQYAVQSGS